MPQAAADRVVIMVEDHPEVLDLGREMLEDAGFTVTAFETADQALAAFGRLPATFLPGVPPMYQALADAALKAVLRTMRGRRTVIIVTHRPSHIELCDRVLMLQDGRVARDLPAADFLKIMKGSGK